MIATSKDSAPPQPASSASSPILATSSVHMSGTAEAVSLFDTHTKGLIWVLPFFLVHLLVYSFHSLDFHTQQRLMGSAVAGVSELMLFHPVDTIAKRIMTTESRLVVNSISGTAGNLNAAVFKESAGAGLGTKFGR